MQEVHFLGRDLLTAGAKGISGHMDGCQQYRLHFAYLLALQLGGPHQLK